MASADTKELTITEEAKAAKDAGSLLDQVIDKTSFNDPVANLLDNRQFSQILRAAKLMASSSLVPNHLKGRSMDETIANMFLVINQALRWRMDPFAVARESYVVSGNLGYQGKLVAAVINCRADLADRLSYSYSGTGQNLTVTVSGRLEGESKPRTIELAVKDAATKNEMWTKDPQQKLAYTGATKWARRHAPEVMLGVMTEDDLDIIDTAPSKPRTNQRASRSSAADLLGPSTAETDSKPEPEPETDDDRPAPPELPDHLFPARDELRKCKESDEFVDLINKWAKDPDEFAALADYADWLMDTGVVKRSLDKAKQGNLIDKGQASPD